MLSRAGSHIPHAPLLPFAPPPYIRPQAFAGDLAGGVENVSRLAGDMVIPLDQLTAVLDRDINSTGLRYNITRVADFLDNAPSPVQFSAALTALDEGMRGALRWAAVL